ncbi:MAG: GNAT family N-acetyltransferase [Planctomycetes bacterium]|nr:GNAT family N-acetyltransferase [Planctomycetota bacterium]MCB9829471.1 GNAT family N-acetyltransferase [Planctomycetota bacterium]MCB9900596.1 GNAT family N-acetyltransferase [Planctomycetota bacterium]
MRDDAEIHLHRVTAADHALVREVRLRALREDPDAFGSTFEHEKDRTPEEWAAFAGREHAATFLALAAGRPVGIAGGSPYRPPSTKIGLFGMWVAPEARGRGVGGRLVDAVVAWAREAGHRRLYLDVGDANPGAVRLYASRGFEPTGVTGAVDAERPHITEHERVVDL